MKIIIQRVRKASVEVEGKIVGAIDRGLMLLVGFGSGDTEAKLKPAAEKIINMRIFPDERGRFHHSLSEVQGELLVVSQFTLFADTRGGRRPEFFGALEPQQATVLFDKFLEQLRASGVAKVAAGIFGAMMLVSLENDGPVTIPLEI